MKYEKIKLDIPYAVKSNNLEYKEIDLSKRTVDLIANTYYYYDSVGDVLVDGCCSKSIQERGVNSSLPGKIKHLMHHNWDQNIAKPILIEEALINNTKALHAQSYFPETDDAERELIKYQSGMWDQHSIGYRYMNVELVEMKSSNWDEYLKLLINNEDAIEKGFMYIIKEIMLFEYSTVSFGANKLTPYLGSKSANKNVQYNNFCTKLDAIHQAYKAGFKDKYILECQERQVKQLIYELLNEPEDETTVRPVKSDTPNYNYLINNL